MLNKMRKAEYLIVVDIGGTNVRVTLVHQNGTIMTHHRSLTPKNPAPEIVLNVVDDLLQQDDRYQDAATMVMGIPGLVDSESGIVRKNGNLSWDEVPLTEYAQHRWSQRILIENDVRLHTLGEMSVARGVQDMLCVVIGTGIAVGVVVNRTIYRGAHFAAGELGHFSISTSGEMCGCGKSGCLETVCGVRGLSLLYQQIKGYAISDFHNDLIVGLYENEPCAISAWQCLGRKLAWALSSAILLFDPQKIVMGGGLGRLYSVWSKYFLPYLEDYLIPGGPRPEIQVSTLGDHAVTLGALALARSKGWLS